MREIITRQITTFQASSSEDRKALGTLLIYWRIWTIPQSAKIECVTRFSLFQRSTIIGQEMQTNTSKIDISHQSSNVLMLCLGWKIQWSRILDFIFWNHEIVFLKQCRFKENDIPHDQGTCALYFKEFKDENSMYVVISCLAKDITSKNDLFRINALRTLPYVLDQSNLV